MNIRYPVIDTNLVNLLEKYHRGDGITDEELDTLLIFYTKTLECIHTLDLADRSYHFAFCEIQRRFHELTGFKNARDENKRYELTGRGKTI